MTENKCYLHPIQKDPKYQIFIRECSDRAAQGLLTLLVTINVAAFVATLELLKSDYWLLMFFTVSTFAALLSRAGIFYIYRQEVTMFEVSTQLSIMQKLDKSRMKWWEFTEFSAWVSLLSFMFGVATLTALFIFVA